MNIGRVKLEFTREGLNTLHIFSASCNPNFIDSQNYTCQNYGSMDWCGSSWISNFTVNGEDASDCPECGCVEVGKLIRNISKYFGNKDKLKQL